MPEDPVLLDELEVALPIRSMYPDGVVVIDIGLGIVELDVGDGPPPEPPPGQTLPGHTVLQGRPAAFRPPVHWCPPYWPPPTHPSGAQLQYAGNPAGLV